jgi:hypothetical protein
VIGSSFARRTRGGGARRLGACRNAQRPPLLGDDLVTNVYPVEALEAAATLRPGEFATDNAKTIRAATTAG